MSVNNYSTEYKILDAATATAVVSFPTNVNSDVYLTFIGADTPNWAVKIYQAKKAGITFTSDGSSLTAASPSNPYTTQYCTNTSSNAAVDGATGLTINATTPVRIRVNDFYNGQIGIGATRTAGNLTVWVEQVCRSLNGV
jgi:hypothetical protein